MDRLIRPACQFIFHHHFEYIVPGGQRSGKCHALSDEKILASSATAIDDLRLDPDERLELLHFRLEVDRALRRRAEREDEPADRDEGAA